MKIKVLPRKMSACSAKLKVPQHACTHHPPTCHTCKKLFSITHHHHLLLLLEEGSRRRNREEDACVPSGRWWKRYDAATLFTRWFVFRQKAPKAAQRGIERKDLRSLNMGVRARQCHVWQDRETESRRGSFSCALLCHAAHNMSMPREKRDAVV